MDRTDAYGPKKSRPDDCEHRALLDPLPLFEGEEKIYEQVLTEAATAVSPADIFERMWVEDFVYFSIEALRLRRLKVNLIRANEYKGLSEALTPLLGPSRAETLAKGWAAREPAAVAEVNKTLTSASLSTDHILAQTFSLKLKELEVIDHQMALAEARRNAALHEIERHRQTLGQRLRRAAQLIEDGQVRLIENTRTVTDGELWG
jgi:hypothetical protein